MEVMHSMQLKRAFTLIELLVVIAIIAILAAILFPVFAQAKEAAKKTTAISNTKQHAVGIIMYNNDADDMFIRVETAGQPKACGSCDSVYYWPKLVENYVKSWPLFYDPVEPDKGGIWGGGQYAWWYNWMRQPSWGYNADYLNPVSDAVNCTPWDRKTGYGNPISSSGVASPAATVMIAGTKNLFNSKTQTFYSSEYIDSPAVYNADDACSWSDSGWGTGSWGDKPGFSTKLTYTGAFSPRYSDGGIVGYTDGHAAYVKTGRLAAGTNWKVGIQQKQVKIIDRAQYMWDTQQ